MVTMRHDSEPDSDLVHSYIPPKKAGAGRFIAATAVMSVMMGAMLWWKLADGKPASPSPAAPPSATAVAGVNENPPPPPPPVADTPAREEKTAAAKRSASAGPSDCSATCSGSASAELQSALRAKAGAARGCYERALRRNETLQGQMTVGVRVSSTGRVCGASIVKDGLGDPAVASCVASLMRAGNLPAATGGCVDLQVPMSFVGKK
jgi:hypothetical protein